MTAPMKEQQDAIKRTLRKQEELLKTEILILEVGSSIDRGNDKVEGSARI